MVAPDWLLQAHCQLSLLITQSTQRQDLALDLAVGLSALFAPLLPASGSRQHGDGNEGSN